MARARASFEYVNSKGWLDKKLARMLFTIGLARSPKAPDSPTVVELAPDGRGKNIMRLAASASEIGRSFLAPPGTAPERARDPAAGLRAHGPGPGGHR